jgi:hypothetical protein
MEDKIYFALVSIAGLIGSSITAAFMPLSGG